MEVWKLLGAARHSLRITQPTFDDEINLLLYAGVDDLFRAGVDVHTHPQGTLCKTALILYVKIHFGNNPIMENLERCYERIKTQLAIGGNTNE